MAEKQTSKQTIILAVVLVIAAVCAGAYTLMTRGVVQQEACCPAHTAGSIPASADKPVERTPVARKPAAPLVDAENAPLTLDALRLMPEQAQTAVGIPSVASLIERVAPLVQDVFKNDMDVLQELDAVAHDLAQDMEVSDEGGLVGVLMAMGIDANKGMALFLDLEELAQDAIESAGVTLDTLPDMTAAKAAVAVPVLDANKAEESLRKLAGDLLSGFQAEEIMEGAIAITVYDDTGAYFFTETMLVAGNDLDFVKGVAARVAAPAQLRYGSTECPPDDPQEAVMLVRGDRLIPVLEKAEGLAQGLDPSLQMLVQSQLARMKAIYAESDVDDPVIITLNVRDDAIELVSKMDTEMYPVIKEQTGEARTLRWAPLLPENTLAFLSLCFSPEAKKQITEVYLEAIPEDVRQSPGFSQGMMYSKNVMEMLGGEITLGMTGLDPLDFPSIFLMVELANPAAAQFLLQMAPQANHGDPHREVQIKMLAMPSPIPVYFTVLGSALLLSNSDVGIKDIIDLVKDEETSTFFASLSPPLDATATVYQTLVLKPALYGDIVAPLMTLAGRPVMSEVSGVFDVLGQLFEELRFVNGMEDGWMVTRLQVSRNK